MFKDIKIMCKAILSKQFENNMIYKIYRILICIINNNKQRATLITYNYLHFANEKNEFTI